MHEHVTAFRQGMEKLNTMGDEYKIPDRNFALLLIISLPESWDPFTTSYFGSKANSKATTITSSELIELLISEDCHCCTKSADNEVVNACKIANSIKRAESNQMDWRAQIVGSPAIQSRTVGRKGGGKKDKGQNKRKRRSPRLSLVTKVRHPNYPMRLIWQSNSRPPSERMTGLQTLVQPVTSQHNTKCSRTSHQETRLYQDLARK